MGKCIENKDRDCLYGSLLSWDLPQDLKEVIIGSASEGTSGLVKLSHTENSSVSFRRKEVPENDGKEL